MSAPTTPPNHGALLATLNNPARVSEADLKEAKKLLKKWYPQSYKVWMEHNG